MANRIENIIMQEALANIRKGVDTVKNISHMKDPNAMLLCTKAAIQPWKDSLPKEYIPKIIEIWPESLPATWTYEEAMTFFMALSRAMFRDSVPLRTIDE